MSFLPDELFNVVENKVLAARKAAEKAAKASLKTLAVEEDRPYTSMGENERSLRRALRAKARQLGEGDQDDGINPLVEEIAYQQWHRMLFARFLAENDLLMHPSGVPVTLQDCADLVEEEGESDAWGVAAKYASEMLPGIFRLDDPVVELRFAPEGRIELENLLNDLPEVVFKADDSLGWMYQFWQSKEKDEIKDSETKIGGDEIAPVTQLFTENYMVRFLLENSLGAWWARKHPESPLLEEYDYLRYKEDGTPAAGIFEGWPETAAEVTVMDPCCGSGHFLVVAFEMLRQMRMAEEGLDATEAGDAVLRDNMHGLDIDLRATQIAAFSVAMIAWKTGGYRELPELNIACSGIPVKGSLESWMELVGADERVKRAVAKLYEMFENAPTLGSLVNPSLLSKDDPLFTAHFYEIIPILEKKLDEQNNGGKIISSFSIFDTIRSAILLANKYILVSTNVPYLGRSKQNEILINYCDEYYPKSNADLATVFIERCREFTRDKSTYSLVMPQNWTFLVSYEDLREKLLSDQSWNSFVRLGPQAFNTPMYDFNVALLIVSNIYPKDNSIFLLDVSDVKGIDEKANQIKEKVIKNTNQKCQLLNPDHRLIMGELPEGKPISNYASAPQGLKTGDDNRHRRYFWEVSDIPNRWRYYQSTPSGKEYYDGMSYVIDWVCEGHNMARLQGQQAWDREGVVVGQMSNLPASIHMGHIQDSNVNVIVPFNNKHIRALYCFINSGKFVETIRMLDQKVSVTNSSMELVPFDIEHWQEVAEEKFPDGLPEPHSNDPTQWLFEGHPAGSTNPLQVTVARLLGYQWMEQEPDDLDEYVDEDGIVTLVPTGKEEPAADRLRALLATAYGEDWSPDKQRELLDEVDFKDKTLEDWLRDGFFIQHVKLFNNRPFIWHIWDGRKDGFHALVNYHKLDAATLDKLIYTYLGSWVDLQRGQRNFGEPGADGRLVAALELKEKLEAIREGKSPYDIYVRWKELAEQPIGWNPDLDDGVRLNIRPFVKAGVLRRKFTVHWRKDRGKNPDGSERLNDLHFTNEEKRRARAKR